MNIFFHFVLVAVSFSAVFHVVFYAEIKKKIPEGSR